YPYLLGEDVAFLIGFQIIDDKHVMIPDVNEVRGFINKFNESLPPGDARRILIRPVDQDASIASYKRYNERFRISQEIPVTNRGKQMFHDISTHALEGFFLGNDVVERLLFHMN